GPERQRATVGEQQIEAHLGKRGRHARRREEVAHGLFILVPRPPGIQCRQPARHLLLPRSRGGRLLRKARTLLRTRPPGNHGDVQRRHFRQRKDAFVPKLDVLVHAVLRQRYCCTTSMAAINCCRVKGLTSCPAVGGISSATSRSIDDMRMTLWPARRSCGSR